MPFSESQIRDRLQRAAVWMSAARILSILLNMTLQMVLARLLAPGDFGTYALLTSIIAVTAIAGLFGMNEVSVRFIAGEMAIGGPRRANQAALTAMRFCSVSVPVAAVAIGALCYFFGQHWLPPAAPRWSFALLLACGGAALAAQQFAADALRGFHELRWASLFSGGLAGGPLSVFTLVVLSLGASMGNPLSLRTALLLFVLAIALVLPVSWSRLVISMRQRAAGAPPAATHPSLVGPIFRMGAIMMAVHLLSFITQQADLWIGSQLLPREQLGLYHASRRMVLLIGIPIQVSMVTIASTVAELRAREQHGHLQQLLRSAATAAAIPMLGTFLVLGLFAKPILGIVFGEYYQEAVWPLIILIVGYSALALCGNPLNVLNVAGGHGASLTINVLASIFLFTVGPWWTREFGLNGLAAASAASFAVQNIAGWLTARGLLGVWTHVSLRALWRRNR